LLAAGDWVQFDGALATRCELIDGPCMDLNLMVSKASPAASVRIEALHEPLCPSLAVGECMLVFPLDAAVELRSGAAAQVLDPWDVAVWSAQDEPPVRLAPAAGGERQGRGTQVMLATLR
jgi:environmental stress-induced protein Ves